MKKVVICTIGFLFCFCESYSMAEWIKDFRKKDDASIATMIIQEIEQIFNEDWRKGYPFVDAIYSRYYSSSSSKTDFDLKKELTEEVALYKRRSLSIPDDQLEMILQEKVRYFYENYAEYLVETETCCLEKSTTMLDMSKTNISSLIKCEEAESLPLIDFFKKK